MAESGVLEVKISKYLWVYKSFFSKRKDETFKRYLRYAFNGRLGWEVSRLL